MKGGVTLLASVGIAGLAVGVGWNGRGTATWGVYALAIVGAWCLLNLIGFGVYALLVDHWRSGAARTARRGPSDRGQGRTPRLVKLPSPGVSHSPRSAERDPGLGTTKVSRPVGH